MTSPTHPESEHVDAVIVGAGFAGLYMIYRLRELGYSVICFEAASDVGGTWYWNRYPGARCDIESLFYSYSFSEELQQEWEWSERYATQPEILRYIEHVADRFDLRRHITFDARVTTARFDEASATWRVTTEAGATVTRFLIMATGCVSATKDPEVDGLDSFAGAMYHTGRWVDGDGDFDDRTVGVIGTGSSGIQCIPIIAESAKQLYVFQRTPNYTLPARNQPLDPSRIAEVKRNYGQHRELARRSILGVPTSDAPPERALDVPPDERSRRYQEAWDNSSLFAFGATFCDLLTDADANATSAEFIRSRVRDVVQDEDVVDALMPRHIFGIKRTCLDTNYYATFNRDNVRLVDLRKTPIVEVIESGVRTTDQEYALDTLVLATGFDAMTGSILKVDIRGIGDISLRDRWRAGPKTYLGLCTNGFPNLFFITGPGSPSVLSNIIVSIEQHVEWISDCMQWLDDHDLATIEASLYAEQAWVEHVDEVAEETLYPRGNSWYLGANVPGKPRVFMPYVAGVGTYREKCDAVVQRGYDGFVTTEKVPKERLAAPRAPASSR